MTYEGSTSKNVGGSHKASVNFSNTYDVASKKPSIFNDTRLRAIKVGGLILLAPITTSHTAVIMCRSCVNKRVH